FTNPSCIGLVSYNCASACQTSVCTLRRNGTFPLQRWPCILQLMRILFYSTIATFVPIIVILVFWALLPSPSTFAATFSGWSNIAQHAMNSLFALFEILSTNVRPTLWVHIVFLEVFLAYYLGVAYITKATEGFYTYGFLDPHARHALLAAYIAAIGSGGALVLAVVKALVKLRVRTFRARGDAQWKAEGCEERNSSMDVEGEQRAEVLFFPASSYQLPLTSYKACCDVMIPTPYLPLSSP
ncbi:hypothetical protein FIBSPDRAFT_739925, partial [Athelia psychrophila]